MPRKNRRRRRATGRLMDRFNEGRGPMPRKNLRMAPADDGSSVVASMRPRPDAAEKPPRPRAPGRNSKPLQ